MPPLLVAIKGNALDDGPGIRSVVFFKGCPLSCVWCHNPEAQAQEPELLLDPGPCLDCHACIPACPPKAICLPRALDRRACTLCFDCVAACPSGALKRVGHCRTEESILEELLRDKVFYDHSGGGVTLSGGEASFQMEAAGRILEGLKAHGVHTLVETCGAFDLEKFSRRMLPHLDLIYYDLKIMDAATHKKYCGADNGRILDNFKQLSLQARDASFELVPRTPLVPGITDTKENLMALARFLKSCGVGELTLLPYHPMGMEKWEQLGKKRPKLSPKLAQNLTQWLDKDRLAKARATLNNSGIQTL